MANTNGNVVEHVLQCMQVVDKHMNKIRDSSTQGETLKELCVDALEEVTVALCKLLGLLITAPISGRMFVPLPASHFDAAAKKKSLQEQLGDTQC